MRPGRLFAISLLSAGVLHAGLLVLGRPGGLPTAPARLVEITIQTTVSGEGSGGDGPAVPPSPAGPARAKPPLENPATEPPPPAPAVPVPPSPGPPAPTPEETVSTQPVLPEEPEPVLPAGGQEPHQSQETPEPVRLPAVSPPAAPQGTSPDAPAAGGATTVALTPAAGMPAGGPPGAAGVRAAPGSGSTGPLRSGDGDGSGSGTPGASPISPARPRAPLLPAYPRAARRDGQEGLVRVLVEIDAAGGVISARVASTSGHVLLDQAALDAVRTALYVPAEQGGRRIPSRLIVPVRFRLTAGGGR